MQKASGKTLLIVLGPSEKVQATALLSQPYYSVSALQSTAQVNVQCTVSCPNGLGLENKGFLCLIVDVQQVTWRAKYRKDYVCYDSTHICEFYRATKIT